MSRVGVGDRLNFAVSEKQSGDSLSFNFFTVILIPDSAYSVDFVSVKIPKTSLITNGNRLFWIQKNYCKKIGVFRKKLNIFSPAIVPLESFFAKTWLYSIVVWSIFNFVFKPQ